MVWIPDGYSGILDLTSECQTEIEFPVTGLANHVTKWLTIKNLHTKLSGIKNLNTKMSGIKMFPNFGCLVFWWLLSLLYNNLSSNLNFRSIKAMLFCRFQNLLPKDSTRMAVWASATASNRFLAASATTTATAPRQTEPVQSRHKRVLS